MSKAITYIPHEGRSEKGPKTKAGNRDIQFFGDDALIFAAHLNKIGKSDQLLFTDATGEIRSRTAASPIIGSKRARPRIMLICNCIRFGTITEPATRSSARRQRPSCCTTGSHRRGRWAALPARWSTCTHRRTGKAGSSLTGQSCAGQWQAREHSVRVTVRHFPCLTATSVTGSST